MARRFNQPNREFYIPKGATKITVKDLPLVFYVYSTPKGDPAALCFKGKAHKPFFRFRFIPGPNGCTAEQAREDRIRSTIEAVRKDAEAKAARRKERNSGKGRPEIGTLMHTNWGYEQTNVEHFQVVGHKGKTTLILREVAGARVDTEYMQGRTAPVFDDFIGEPFERRWNGLGVKICNVRTAWPNQGNESFSFSSYH